MRRVEYPHLPDGSVSPQVKNELRKMVDQINMALADVERSLNKGQGGTENGN